MARRLLKLLLLFLFFFVVVVAIILPVQSEDGTKLVKEGTRGNRVQSNPHVTKQNAQDAPGPGKVGDAPLASQKDGRHVQRVGEIHKDGLFAHSQTVVCGAGGGGGKIEAARNHHLGVVVVLRERGNRVVALAKVGVVLLENEKQRASTDPDDQCQEEATLEDVGAGAEDVVQLAKGRDEILQLEQPDDSKNAKDLADVPARGHGAGGDQNLLDVPGSRRQEVDNAKEGVCINLAGVERLAVFGCAKKPC
mmetsp:Transcript_8198/g.24231  ORF Transcript_8198/g.24231 Transcript_8198/m.24231 type:complete len:250 (-) Transcript_8198:2069-2818(-)